MRLLAIDPGPVESAWIILDGPSLSETYRSMRRPVPTIVAHQKQHNLVAAEAVRNFARSGDEIDCVIEMLSHYGQGMAVGIEVFDTAIWIGRFMERWRRGRMEHGRAADADDPDLLQRWHVKTHLCRSARATDANIRRACIDRYGGEPVALAGKKCSGCHDGLTKAERPHERCKSTGWLVPKGPLYDISKDVWQALGLGITYLDGVRWERK